MSAAFSPPRRECADAVATSLLKSNADAEKIRGRDLLGGPTASIVGQSRAGIGAIWTFG